MEGNNGQKYGNVLIQGEVANVGQMSSEQLNNYINDFENNIQLKTQELYNILHIDMK